MYNAVSNTILLLFFVSIWFRKSRNLKSLLRTNFDCLSFFLSVRFQIILFYFKLDKRKKLLLLHERKRHTAHSKHPGVWGTISFWSYSCSGVSIPIPARGYCRNFIISPQNSFHKGPGARDQRPWGTPTGKDQGPETRGAPRKGPGTSEQGPSLYVGGNYKHYSYKHSKSPVKNME